MSSTVKPWLLVVTVVEILTDSVAGVVEDELVESVEFEVVFVYLEYSASLISLIMLRSSGSTRAM
jgi:hypothetical protein